MTTTDASSTSIAILPGRARLLRPDAVRTFRAMASDIDVRVVAPNRDAEQALDRAEQVFHDVEAACTRFDPSSPLMLANADPDSWHVVPWACFLAIGEAASAHRATGGRFDPRVLRALTGFGYDRSLAFETQDVSVHGDDRVAGPAASGPWQPELDELRCAVRLGPDPIDLGGIGKGLAVRWAAEQLVDAGAAVLVEAGGDCWLGGRGPDGDGWRVAVEDPRGGDDPVAVLGAGDRACATSSVRVRRWRADGVDVHHLIDPTTGRPGGTGLMSVTVLGADPADAEVWSKALFLTGLDGIRAAAEDRGLAALWVEPGGRHHVSAAMEPHVVWRAEK